MIETRLEKLDKEKEELSQYYALDKERRFIFPLISCSQFSSRQAAADSQESQVTSSRHVV